MSKRAIKSFCLVFLVVAGIFNPAAVFLHPAAAEAAANLSGRILLQVQDKGQAWYVNPLDDKRYYLGRPDDAFLIMRSFGLGISNSDLNSFAGRAPARLSGRILLQVQDKGQAYYVDPVNLGLHYLGRPADAFAVMRNLGLGISNRDLAAIAVGINPAVSAPAPVATTVTISSSIINNRFAFKYANSNYELVLPLSTALYDSYKNSSKVYTYVVGDEPADLRNEFYGIFLKIKAGDASLNEIAAKFKQIAVNNNLTDDQLLEFALAFIQYIPYDEAKLANGTGTNNNPYFPYETLYLDKGVCSDKTFLAVALLRKLGYGAAILDFPDRNHTALGVACPPEYSLANSGYCYVETTNYFPIGVIPQSIANGQAQTVTDFSNLFDTSSLGKIEIYQKTSGKAYGGLPALRTRVIALQAAKQDLDSRQAAIDNLNASLSAQEIAVKALKSKLDGYYQSGRISEYNSLVPEYNDMVNEYNDNLAAYRTKVEEYNVKAAEYNTAAKAFYQQ